MQTPTPAARVPPTAFGGGSPPTAGIVLSVLPLTRGYVVLTASAAYACLDPEGVAHTVQSLLTQGGPPLRGGDGGDPPLRGGDGGDPPKAGTSPAQLPLAGPGPAADGSGRAPAGPTEDAVNAYLLALAQAHLAGRLDDQDVRRALGALAATGARWTEQQVHAAFGIAQDLALGEMAPPPEPVEVLEGD